MIEKKFELMSRILSKIIVKANHEKHTANLEKTDFTCWNRSKKQQNKSFKIAIKTSVPLHCSLLHSFIFILKRYKIKQTKHKNENNATT